MKTGLIYVFGILIIHGTSVAAPPEQQKQWEEKLKNVAEASQSNKAACEKFRDEAHVYAPPYTGDVITPLGNRADFDKLLGLIKNYPGENESTRKAFGILSYLRSEFDDPDVSGAKQIYICELIQYLHGANKLIASANPLHLSKKDKQQLTHSILTVVHHETKQASNLMSLLVQEAIVMRLISTHLLEVSDAIFVGLNQLSLDLDKFRYDVHYHLEEMNSDPHKFKLSQRNFEQDRLEAYQEALLALLSRIGG